MENDTIKTIYAMIYNITSNFQALVLFHPYNKQQASFQPYNHSNIIHLNIHLLKCAHIFQC
jgi:hypothetical protein